MSTKNKTIKLTEEELVKYSAKVYMEFADGTKLNRGYSMPCLEILRAFPSQSVDLCIADPPYNMNKNFGQNKFAEMSLEEYEKWLFDYLLQIYHVLKSNGTLYVCGDWKSSTAIHEAALSTNFNVVNRITFEREKGRGSKLGWKNSSEDIWMLTKSKNYTFNVDAVKLKRRVIAPYKDKESGENKDWESTQDGNYRLTYPSNLWTDLTVPFWSMAENTEHSCQKPEKLIAKLILASSNPGDLVLDLFSGSGTTSVVAKKLGRNYIYCESDLNWCAVAEKRLEMAETDKSIQGYDGKQFLHRNML